MSPELLSAVAFVIGVIVAMNTSRALAARHAFDQQQILRTGIQAEGTVTQVWQPPLAGSFPRIYFRFEPRAGGAAIECCHIDRRPQGLSTASLPAVGSSVSIRYLPENPRSAVIARLVSRFLQ